MKHEMMFWFIIIFIKYVVKYELHIAFGVFSTPGIFFLCFR